MNAFVTGGSRGIGRAIVLRYVQEGWGVAFTYATNSAAAEETIAAAKAINSAITVKAYQLDLHHADAIEKICEQVQDEFDTIHAVVNNAAILKDGPAALMSNEDWQEVLQVNLTAPFLISRSFLMHFLSQRKGRFVHISSLTATGSTGQINYATAKSGLEGMSRTLAKEYGAKGITSNIVTVGYVPTDLTKHHMSAVLSKFWIEHCPMHRVGTPEEVAAAVYFLSSSEASFISGDNIHVTAAFDYAP